MKRKLKFFASGFLFILLTACGSVDSHQTTITPQVKATTIPLPATSNTPIVLEQATPYTTQNNLTGNHLINGATDLLDATPLDIPLDGKPTWLVSAPYKNGIVFAAIMENGKVQAFKISGQSFEPYDISPKILPAGMPPVLAVTEDKIQLISPPGDASLLTNPILIENKLIYIDANGDLVSSDSTSQARLPINALIDSRILMDENKRLLILSQPTDRYNHGVLGDAIEASAITLVETTPELRIIQNILIEAPDVIEGLSPIWADIDNDRVRDIIVTLSNNQTGARIAAYRENGTLLAESPPIGLGHRWRHQIAVAEFEPGKPPLLVDVRTPHIGGILEFFQYNNGKLEVVTEIKGFSTHTIGSRNLDSAIAGDFNDDGVVELLAPDQAHISLGIISLEGVIATLSLDGVLTTNLTVTALDGRIFVGAGTQGNLRIWIP